MRPFQRIQEHSLGEGNGLIIGSREGPIMLMDSLSNLGGPMSRGHMDEQVWGTVSIKSLSETGEN